MTSHHRTHLLGIAALGVLAVSCGDDSPGKGSLTGPSRPGASEQTVLAVRIDGPENLPPGASAQYRAILQKTDGTEAQAQSSEITWGVNTMLQADQSGLVTASTQMGLGVVSVNVKNMPRYPVRAAREVVVQPAGTFRITVGVGDNDIPNSHLTDVEVAIRDSADPSAPAIRSSVCPGGTCGFYGAPPSGYLHIRRGGYQSIVQRYDIDRNTIFNLGMTVDPGARLELGGTYTMTVEARTCDGRPPLPDALRRREYTASIEASGPWMIATLRDATFHAKSNRFAGEVRPGLARITLTGFYDPYYYRNMPESPDLAEVLGDGSVLVVSGTVTLTGSSDQLSGTLGGSMTQYDAPTFPSVHFRSACNNPVITLTRR